MKRYITIIGFVALVVAMLIVVNSSVDAASPAPVPDSGSRNTVSPTLNSGSPFAPGALAHRHEEKNADSDSTAKSDDKAEEKPDLRTVDWNKAKDEALVKTAANGNGDKDEEEDAEEEEEEEEEEESEGFDRLWDVATLG